MVAAHLHHGQREEADKEQALCEAFAVDLGISFLTGRANVPQIAEDMKVGLEEAGRHARYAFFEQARRNSEAHLIATAHTRNDHVETVVMNLTRGSGMSGLAGIPATRGNIVRPLLPFSRDETREYCEEYGLWFHDDPANHDLSFTRARIRHRILPELLALNPSADVTIARTASLIAEEDGFLNGMAAAALERSEYPLNGELAFLSDDVEVAFHLSQLGHLPTVLFRRAIRLAVEAVGGSLDHRQTSAVVEGVSRQESGSVTTEGGGVAVEWNTERIHIRDLQPTIPFRFPLTVPGETSSDEFGWAFYAHEAESMGETSKRASLEVELDPAKIRGQLYFRTVQAGDEMKPLGFKGRRKISDLLSEAKLTSAARSRLPIVCDLVGPIWVPGVCLDERMRKESETTGVLRLRFAALATDGRHNTETAGSV